MLIDDKPLKTFCYTKYFKKTGSKMELFSDKEIQEINAEIAELNTTLKSDLLSDEDIKEIEDITIQLNSGDSGTFVTLD